MASFQTRREAARPVTTDDLSRALGQLQVDLEKLHQAAKFNLGSTGQPEKVYFDADGDVRLLVHGLFGLRSVFIVSSKAMMFVCDSWKRMLAPDGHFREAQRSDGPREISMPDDDVNALSILLNIAHLRFDKVPAFLTFQDLLAVSVLADKYEAARAFQPWLSMWINHLRHTVKSPGYEEWLWIAWAFGERAIFAEISARLVREVCVDDSGKCITSAGRVLDPMGDDTYFPPDIIESILEVRQDTIDALLDACYKYLDKYLSAYNTPGATSICQHCRDGRERECDAKILGAFILSLQEKGLGLTREDAEQVNFSVNELSMKLSTITVGDCRWVGRSRSSVACDFSRQLQQDVEMILSSIPTAVQGSHVRHMERQKRHF